MITFGLLGGISYLEPILGTLVSASYEFGFKKMSNKWQPKLFFNLANKLIKNKS